MTTDFSVHLSRALVKLSNKTGTYTPQGGSAVEVTGLFEDEPRELGLGALAPMQATEPVFTVELADVPNAREGDALVIDSVSYRLRAPQPNKAIGKVRLPLKKV